MPRSSGNLAAHHADDIRVRAFRIHCHIADPLPRKGQGLGKRIAGKRIIIKRGRIRRIHTLKHNFPVGLIRDQKNIMPVFFLFFLHNFRKLFHGLRGINHTRRVIGRVDQNGGHFFRQHFVKSFKIYLKAVRIRRHHLKPRPGQIHIRRILREIGRKSKNFIPRLGHASKRMGNGARRAGGHKNMVSRIVHLKSSVERSRHLLPDGRNAQTLTVAVQLHWVLFL